MADGAAWLATRQRRNGSYGYLNVENLEVRFVFTQSANIFFRELNRPFTSIPLALSSWGA